MTHIPMTDDDPMTRNRLCQIVAFLLLAFAGLLTFGVVRGVPAEGIALLGLAFWALSGAL